MTNTFRTTILIAASVLLTALLLHGQRELTPTQVGRFQIVSVVIESLQGATELRHPAIFKIDTTTGDCWQYLKGTDAIQNADGTKGSRSYMGWYPVEKPESVNPAR